VCREHDRLARRPKLAGERQHRVARHRVESGSGLVVHQHVGVVDERPRDGDLPSHPLRDVAEPAVAVFEVEPVERVLDPLVRDRPGHLVQVGEKSEVRRRRHLLVQRRFFREEPEVMAHRRLGGAVAGDADLTGRGLDQPREHFQRRRLPRAVGTDDAEHLALRDRKAAVDDGREPAVGLREAGDLDHVIGSGRGRIKPTPAAISGENALCRRTIGAGPPRQRRASGAPWRPAAPRTAVREEPTSAARTICSPAATARIPNEHDCSFST
jgi:hypothetical protein